MDKLTAIDLTNVKVTSIDEATQCWLQHKDEINAQLSSIFILPESLNIEDLEASGFKKVKNFYIHPFLQIDKASDEWFTFLTKCAFLEVMHDSSGPNLSNFIYGYDKDCNRIPRKISNNLYDRLDKFICRLEHPKGRPSIIRHFGTRHGQLAYAKLPKNRKRNLERGTVNRATKRESNKPSLRGLMYGFSQENENRTLICPMSGDKIEGIWTFNENHGNNSIEDIYEIHHARYDQQGSLYKSVSPSEYLNSVDFINLPQEVIEEFLGCIILSENSHRRLHKSHKIDGIDNWLKRFKGGRCIFVPYHWRCEENYYATLKHLEEKCENFKASKALSYEDFKKKHHTTSSREEVILLSSVKV